MRTLKKNFEIMAKEIERKFLVSYIPEEAIGIEIKQGYLQSEKHRTVRIRTIVENTGLKKSFLTIKGVSNERGTSRYEFEKLHLTIKI